MQGPLLRVLAVTLGLILYPREEPGVEDWADLVTEGTEDGEGSPSGVREPRTETPFGDAVPQKDAKAKAQGDRGVTGDKPSESAATSNAPDALRPSEDSRRVYSEGKAENEYVQSKDSGKSHVEPDANPPRRVEVKPDAPYRQASPADQTYAPAVPRREERVNRAPGHGAANENRDHAGGTRGAPTDASRWSGRGERPGVPAPRLSGPPQRDRAERGREGDYLWDIWNTFSAISVVRFLWKYLKRCVFKPFFAEDWIQSNTPPPVECISGRVPLPDSDTLRLFHSRFVKVSQATIWRRGAFLEGLTHDLLEVMRTTSAESAGVVMEEFIQTVSGCDIVVPFVPAEPYGFQCQLWSTSEDGMQGCGKINIVEESESQNGCHCDSSNVQDMVCLLHRQVEKPTRYSAGVYSLLCSKNTTFLSKDKVNKWFSGTIRKAWEQISHKYEFELSLSKRDILGGLVVRFRSGRKVHFTLNPVVKLHNTAAYFSTTPCTTNISDISWTVSLTNYEDKFFKHVCKTLPEHACHSQVLDIISFLHQKQTALTGSSALKDFHYKNALMELLLSTGSSQWHPKDIHCRLRDLVVLMEKSLRQRVLHHALIGNSLAQNIELPTELSQARRVNLFHPLVVRNGSYTKTVQHFQEMLRNAFILMEDYVSSERKLDQSKEEFLGTVPTVPSLPL